MLVFDTQMHIVTFIFVCIELVIFFYLLIYSLARPDDKAAHLNIVLIFLLLLYNVTGGLLPDEKLPGSFFIQMDIAYATGFITPCYFPYYVHKAFSLEKMRFHAYKGVYLFLILPYILFVLVFAATNHLDTAKNLLILPVLYAVWVIYSLVKAIRYKYKNIHSGSDSKEEIIVLFLSITPWVGLPVIDFFNLGQALEASITNFGFLLLFGLQMKRHIKELRLEHQNLIDSEKRLLNWNANLKIEVDKRTRELENINEQRTNTFVNLAHETKTPLTLINNYFEEYISKNENSEELSIVKRNLDKLSSDIVNLFDLEKFNKGFAVYNHELISNISDILKDSTHLFKKYAIKRNIELSASIEDEIFIMADPLAVNRIINNLIENAIKFCRDGGLIAIRLQNRDNKIEFTVKDSGIGIPVEMQKKVFEPYFQITNPKTSTQGMGLGLPIVKKIIEELKGQIMINSNPQLNPGTEITVKLAQHILSGEETLSALSLVNYPPINTAQLNIEENQHDEEKRTILIVEDNISMINYLLKKLLVNYNVYASVNGNDALRKMKNTQVLPDLIITDIMMDKLDGYAFAKIISANPTYNHIPFIFISAKATSNDRLDGLKLGAIDYIQKPFIISELLQKIESILLNASKQKKAFLNTAFNNLNPKENVFVKNGTHRFEENCQLYQLTNREAEIAKLICQGHKYKAISESLFIAERTVTKHAQNIFEKAGVSTKIELINKLEFV
jgi:signal transduction histidine kinase/DNA-binding NarL/FixJ family response regulator